MDVPVKYPYVGGTKWAIWRWADIPDAKNPGRVYLRRLRILQTPWFAFYLHWIFLPDDDRDPHDHPFTFWSFIVRGGYTERLYRVVRSVHRDINAYERRWNQWTLHKMGKSHAHMIHKLQPGTISLVMVGPKDGGWGFYTPAGFVSWEEYHRGAPEYALDELA